MLNKCRSTSTVLCTRLLSYRFFKFALVGGLGVVINLAVLYFCQEYLFGFIQKTSIRLDCSLIVAIFFATINNFIWNRLWTWGDRKQHWQKHILFQFTQYALACWLGILLQLLLTKLFAIYIYYLIANLIAIVFASFFNFALNSAWTFHARTHDSFTLPPNDNINF